jgi:chemotaxis signal transduction protein
LSGGSSPSLLHFRVGSVQAALPLGLVREILEGPGVVRVPGTLPQVCGVILRQGVAVPVYDLTRFASLWKGRPEETTGAPGERRHLIVCDWGDSLVAILADGVDLLEPDGVSPADGRPPADEAIPEDVPGPPERLRPEFVGSMMRRGDEIVAVLDPVRLFASLGVPAAPGGDAEEGDGEKDPARR